MSQCIKNIVMCVTIFSYAVLKFQVYCVVFELLEFFLKLYVPEETDAPTPPVQLPLPFYSERHREPIENRVSILSETDLNEILRYSTRKRKVNEM